MKESAFDIQDPRYKLDLQTDDELIENVKYLKERAKKADGTQFGPSERMRLDEVMFYAKKDRGLFKDEIEETSFNHVNRPAQAMYE